MPTADELRSKLNEVFKITFDDDAIVIFDEMTAEDVFDWDSVSHISLVLMVEQEFGVSLNASEVGELENVGEMIKLLQQKAKS